MSCYGDGFFEEIPEERAVYEVNFEVDPRIAGFYDSQRYSYIVTSLRQAEKLKGQLFAFPEQVEVLYVRPGTMAFCRKGNVGYFASRAAAMVYQALGRGEADLLLEAILAHHN